MTKAPSKQNQKLIDILKYARDNCLWVGNSRNASTWVDSPRGKCAYICYAIADANERLHGKDEVPAKLDRMIDKHIHFHATMKSFLASDAALGWGKVNAMSHKTVQTYRFMLVNHMIRLLGGTP